MLTTWVLFFPTFANNAGPSYASKLALVRPLLPGENGVPNFDREKCVHCGACLWNCTSASPETADRMGVAFYAGTGGLHSAEN